MGLKMRSTYFASVATVGLMLCATKAPAQTANLFECFNCSETARAQTAVNQGLGRWWVGDLGPECAIRHYSVENILLGGPEAERARQAVNLRHGVLLGAIPLEVPTPIEHAFQIFCNDVTASLQINEIRIGPGLLVDLDPNRAHSVFNISGDWYSHYQFLNRIAGELDVGRGLTPAQRMSWRHNRNPNGFYFEFGGTFGNAPVQVLGLVGTTLGPRTIALRIEFLDGSQYIAICPPGDLCRIEAAVDSEGNPLDVERIRQDMLNQRPFEIDLRSPDTAREAVRNANELDIPTNVPVSQSNGWIFVCGQTTVTWQNGTTSTHYACYTRRR